MNGSEDRDRKFDGQLVRRSCEKIYGGKIDPHAWLRWKKWAGVIKGKRTYTFEQFCFLVAVAKARKKNQYAELDAKKLKAVAYSDATLQMVGALIAHVDNEGWALGWDVRSALAVRGIEIDGAMLRRVMPEMRPNGWYQVDAVIARLDAMKWEECDRAA